MIIAGLEHAVEVSQVEALRLIAPCRWMVLADVPHERTIWKEESHPAAIL